MHPQQAGTVPQMPSTYPGAQMFMHMPQSVPMAQMGHNVPIAYYPMGHLYPPGSTVLVEGGYDAGARFGAGSSPSIPVSPAFRQHYCETQQGVKESYPIVSEVGVLQTPNAFFSSSF